MTADDESGGDHKGRRMRLTVEVIGSNDPPRSSALTQLLGRRWRLEIDLARQQQMIYLLVDTNQAGVVEMADTAKLFVTGRSQAVRLPRDYRFEGHEVFIRRDMNGDVVLSRKPESWNGFLALAASTEVPDDFMADRKDEPASERELF